MSPDLLPSPFTQRLGASLQRQRRRNNLTQGELAERADLSLKYMGEVERGEANVTAKALERIALVLGWDPWTLFALEQQPISQAVHRLLMSEVGGVRERLRSILDWLDALDPASREVVEGPGPAARPEALPRRRGRPRKDVGTKRSKAEPRGGA